MSEPLSGERLAHVWRFEPAADAASADVNAFRQDPCQIIGEPPPMPKTDEEIIAELGAKVIEKTWPLWSRFANATLQETWEFSDSHQLVRLYNFSDQVALDQVHALQISEALARYQALFPQAVQLLRSITVTDTLPASMWGNAILYPTHAQTYDEVGMFALAPLALWAGKYRRGQLNTATLPAVVAHELTHFIDPIFSAPWNAAGYTWQQHFNKHLFESWVPDRPEECVTDYARLQQDEDICESVTAFLYDPDRLLAISPTKYRLIEERIVDRRRPLEWQAAKDPQPIHPPLPDVVTFYIDENVEN